MLGRAMALCLTLLFGIMHCFGMMYTLCFPSFKVCFDRDVIGSHMLATSSSTKIGGVGTTVEIDESMFGNGDLVTCLLGNLAICKIG